MIVAYLGRMRRLNFIDVEILYNLTEERQKGVRVSSIEAALDQTKGEQAVSIVDNASPTGRSII